MSKASEVLSGVKHTLTEGTEGYEFKLWGENQPKFVAWGRDLGDEYELYFEVDGVKQKAGIRLNKKKKKVTGFRW